MQRRFNLKGGISTLYAEENGWSQSEVSSKDSPCQSTNSLRKSSSRITIMCAYLSPLISVKCRSEVFLPHLQARPTTEHRKPRRHAPTSKHHFRNLIVFLALHLFSNLVHGARVIVSLSERVFRVLFISIFYSSFFSYSFCFFFFSLIEFLLNDFWTKPSFNMSSVSKTTRSYKYTSGGSGGNADVSIEYSADLSALSRLEVSSGFQTLSLVVTIVTY